MNAHTSAIRLGSRSVATPMLRVCGDGAPERERPVILREFFHRLGVCYEPEFVGDEPVEIDLTLHALPGLQFMSGRMQGARYRRSRGNNDPTEDIGLVVNLQGAHMLAQCGREVVLGDGEAALVSCNDALATHHRAPGGILSLRLARPELAARLGGTQDCFLRRIPHGTPALRMLTDYFDVVRHAETHADRALQPAIVSHFYDLVAVAIGASRDAAETAKGNGLRAARLFAIKQDILRNLARPDLSVARRAARHGCTERYVQRLLGREGTRFTEYLLTQRLARAYRLVTDPTRRDEKISAIALEAGFADLSYFNRTFRRRYGTTPSDVRTAARAGR